ncbi:hypothetical protein TorRG33x02_043150 [Trema orientale]|uniref:Uncharacterized protein n=1 Tax=Trema orientale TaxID=63057 RepID=A0A2P5FQ11_TREOI|nr:hypothetical protein TorRG33x02_043150 [Trema orientale]
MAVADEVKEGSSSAVLESPEFDEKSEALSPEDIAWVDSCLIKESEVSEGEWNSMTDALLEILSSQAGLYDDSVSVSEGRPQEDVEMLTSSESAETDRVLGMGIATEEFPKTPQNLLSISEEAESSSDKSPIKEVNDLQSLAFVGNPFLPSYIEGLNETQTDGLETDPGSSVGEIEPLAGDIFRVWDLSIPAEENELDKQLNKILEENDPESKPSAFDGSGLQKDLKEESLDDIIAAIADISLK